MLCSLPLPQTTNYVINVEIEGDTIHAILIVPAPETVATLDSQVGNISALQVVREFMNAYFDENADPVTVEHALRKLLPRLAPAKTDFAQRVRNTLLSRVQFGETATYAELAKMIGNPLAVRAVGQALKANPFQIVVPCHRIVSKDPDKSFYTAGTEIKQQLLHHEAACLHIPMTAQTPF